MNNVVIARNEVTKQSHEVATSLAVVLATAMTLLATTSFIGCSKSPGTATAQDPGPDNAMTRYAENLAQDQRRAQEVADKANAVIAHEQQIANQAARESGDQPQ